MSQTEFVSSSQENQPQTFRMHPTPQVSVIVVSYNNAKELTYCLESIQLNVSLPVEIITLDNASQDGSADLVEANFPEVRLVRSEHNLGFPAANNTAANLATGLYLFFLNPDAIVSQGALEHLVDALEKDPRAGLATAKILRSDQPETINTCGNNIHLSGITQCRGLGEPNTYYSIPASVNAVSGAAFLIRRQLFEYLGGFDPVFFLYLEDTDLSLRARLAGYNCVYVPQAVVYHHYQLRFNNQKIFYLERNRYMLMLKIWRWPTLFALFPSFFLAEIVSLGFCLIYDHSLLNKIKAYLWILRNMSGLMANRCRVQTTRKCKDRVLLIESTTLLDIQQTGVGFVQRIAYWLFNPFFILNSWLLKLIVWW